MTNVCIFGASIVWGANDWKSGGWAEMLKNHLAKKDFFTYNLGVSGDTSSDLLERFRNECIAREPAVIIISVGINDSLYIKTKNNPFVSLDKYKDNLAKILKTALEFTDKIVFVGLTPVDETKTMPIPWDTTMYYTQENAEKYNSAMRDVCKANNIKYVPVMHLLDKKELDDGLHPTTEGHRKLFNAVKEFLEKNMLV